MQSIGRSVETRFPERVEHNCNTTLFCYDCLLFRGQQQAGSLAGAAPCRKDIDRTQSQAHPAWKPGVECEGKSLTDCILKSKECRLERVA